MKRSFSAHATTLLMSAFLVGAYAPSASAQFPVIKLKDVPFAAIQAYSEGYYVNVHHQESPEADELRKRLSEELAQLPPSPGMVWHGGCISDSELEEYKAGKVRTFRFLSTTKVATIAFNYGSVRYGQSGNTCHPILLRLEHSSGREISRFSAFPEEQEILLSAADRFEVVANPELEALPADVFGWMKKLNRLAVFKYFELRQMP